MKKNMKADNVLGAALGFIRRVKPPSLATGLGEFNFK